MFRLHILYLAEEAHNVNHLTNSVEMMVKKSWPVMNLKLQLLRKFKGRKKVSPTLSLAVSSHFLKETILA